MAAMFMGRISTPRFGGVSLVLSSLLLAGGNILVILLLRSAGIAHGTDAYARVITQAKGWWHVAHVLLLLAPAIWMIGFLTLHGILSSKNERVFSLSALLCLSLATVFQMFSALAGGFVNPVLGQQYLRAPAGSREMAALILDYSRLLSLTLAALAILLEMLGMCTLGIALLTAQYRYKWVGWAGAAIGGGGILGYSTGFFDPYWIFSRPFLLLGGASSIWIIVLGIVLYREQRSPGGNARHSGGAPLARRGSR